MATKRKLSNFELLKTKKPYQHPVKICMDSTLTEALEALDGEYARLKASSRVVRRLDETDPGRMEAEAEVDAMEADMDRLKKAIEDNTVTFLFQSLPRKRYQDLQKEHPPSAEEKKEYGDRMKAAGKPASEQVGPRVSNETYPPVLIGEALVDPALPPEEIQEMFGEGSPWNNAELQTLLMGAETACNSVSLGK